MNLAPHAPSHKESQILTHTKNHKYSLTQRAHTHTHKHKHTHEHKHYHPSSEGMPGANQGGQPNAPPPIDGTGTGATTASDEAREARRARMRARTATLKDYQAEIAAQEHELAAAVQKQSEIDSKLNAADTDKKEYEKELKKCEQKLAAKQSRADIVKLERKKERLEASIAVEGRKQSRLLDQSEPLDARIKELHADIAELKQQMGTWHE